MKNQVSKKMLVAIVLNIEVFTAICLALQFYNGSEPSSTLVTAFFAFWTVEILALMGIKVAKVKKNYEEGENYETEDE